MSALGQKRTSLQSFNHFVGYRDESRRWRKAERIGSFEVDGQLKFRRLHNRQICGLITLTDPTGVDTHLAICVRNTGSVTHQAPGDGKLALLENCGNGVACSQCHDLIAPAV